MIISITPRTVFIYLLSAIAALVLMDVALLVLKYGFGLRSIYGFTYLFDLDAEQNLPTLFSTLDLVLTSVLSLLLYRQSRTSSRSGAGYWCGLAVIFALLAIDEFCSIHEHLTKPLQQTLHTSGMLAYAWVIPYSVLVLVFAGAYLRFWWHLPARTRTQFAAAGIIYVGGALGMEMLGAKLDSLYGFGNNMAAGIEVVFEESMEMSGIALFVFALLERLQAQRVSLQFVTAGATHDGTKTVTTDDNALLSDVLGIEPSEHAA